jgi:transposase
LGVKNFRDSRDKSEFKARAKLNSLDEVRKVCIDMKDGLRKAVEAVFPLAKIVVDPFHVIADSIFTSN